MLNACPNVRTVKTAVKEYIIRGISGENTLNAIIQHALKSLSYTLFD